MTRDCVGRSATVSARAISPARNTTSTRLSRLVRPTRPTSKPIAAGSSGARVDAKALEVAADYLDFLDRWSGAVAPRTGAADKIVAFERGSSELVPLQQAAVAAMGEKLRAGSEIVDVVEVAGFAAPDESEDADQLARDRAAAVKALLIETSGLSGDKFALVGSTRPTAVEGVAGGNRATVTPLADYGEQQIIAPVGRANYTTGLSPDGRFALIGQSPRILDLATGRVRGQLGRGTSPKYSPNGRMIAMRSNWNETGDHESRALFIYDSVTGLILHQIAFDSQKMTTAEAYTWSPDSTGSGLHHRWRGDLPLRPQDPESRLVCAAPRSPNWRSDPMVAQRQTDRTPAFPTVGLSS